MKTYIFGAGGHGKVVFDILKSQGIHVDGFVDGKESLAPVFDVPVFNREVLHLESKFNVVVAIGANHVRMEVVNGISRDFPNAKFINAIHATASVSPFSKIGQGSVVAAGAILGPSTILGDHVVINTGAQVDHDCTIGDFATIAPGAVLGGTVTVGKGTYVALRTAVKHGLSIGPWSVIGAGALVMSDVKGNVVAYGSPCKVVRARNQNDPYL